jgi:hypothetical protein
MPSDKGIVLYSEPDMAGQFVTEKPTATIAFAQSNQTFISLGHEITFLDPSGLALRRRSSEGRGGYAISGDGNWLVIS